MKKLIGFVLLVSMFATLNAQAGAILSVRQASAKKLAVKVLTGYYCNDPIAKLNYVTSGRATFGPYYFDLEVIPVNKMLCRDEQETEVLVDVPEGTRSGDHLVIRGEGNSEVTFVYRKVIDIVVEE